MTVAENGIIKNHWYGIHNVFGCSIKKTDFGTQFPEAQKYLAAMMISVFASIVNNTPYFAQVQVKLFFA